MTFQSETRAITAQINMTPMIDVLLVLLIIFMLIAPAHPKGLPAEIPQSSANSALEETSVVLEIAADRSLRVNSQPLNSAQLSPELHRIFQARADRTLFVKGDGDLSFAVVAGVLDTARSAGVDRIALVTRK